MGRGQIRVKLSPRGSEHASHGCLVWLSCDLWVPTVRVLACRSEIFQLGSRVFDSKTALAFFGAVVRIGSFHCIQDPTHLKREYDQLERSM